jgi:16S rRNA A1518/A1519 N6-dimethyltransferase RsmA/KsgA/DIM1 with predicted DNA glycosylase/AP lyase activity
MSVSEHYFTTNLAPIQKALDKISLKDRHVLEIGAGTGALTQILLDKEAKVTAVELTPGLCQLTHPNLTLLECDVRDLDLSFGWDCLVSIPPISMVPFIRSILNIHKVQDACVMVPSRKHKKLFKDFWVACKLTGRDFSPPCEGSHLFVRRGF